MMSSLQISTKDEEQSLMAENSDDDEEELVTRVRAEGGLVTRVRVEEGEAGEQNSDEELINL